MAHKWRFCRLLARQSHDVLWQGRVEDKWPLGWLDAHHVVLESWNGVGVWSCHEGRTLWLVEGDDLLGGYSIWGDAVVCPRTAGLEIKAIDGTTRALLTTGGGGIRELWRVGDYVLYGNDDSPGTVSCMSLRSGERVWKVDLRPLLAEVWTGSVDESWMFTARGPSEAGQVVVQWGPLLLMLELVGGEARWVRAMDFPMLGGEVCAEGRMAAVQAGRCVVLDEQTGETLADAAVEGFLEAGGVNAEGSWESPATGAASNPLAVAAVKGAGYC